MPRLPVTKNGVPVEPEDFSWRHPSVDDPLHVRERRVNFPMSRVEVLSRLGYFILNRALPGLEDTSFDIQAEAPPIILENGLYALTTIITGPTAASLMCAVTYLRHESVHPIVFFEGVDRVNERARSMLRYLRRHGIAIGYAEANGTAMLYMYLLCDRDQDAYALMNTIQANPRRVCVRQLHEWLHYATDEIPKRVLDKIGRPFANLPVAKMVELPFSQKKQATVERRTSSRPPKPTSLVAQRALIRADMLAGYGERCDSEDFDDLIEPFRYTPCMSPSPARSHTAEFAMPAPVDHHGSRPDLESRSSVASPAVAPAPMRVGKKRSRSSDAGSGREEQSSWAASGSVQALRHDLRSAMKAMQDMTRALHSTGQLMASCAQHAMLLPLWSTVAMQQGMPAMAGVTVPPDTSLCGMPEGASASGIAPDPFTNMMMLYQRMMGMSSASHAGSPSPDATPGIQLYSSGADLLSEQDAAAWHSAAGGAYGEPATGGGDSGRPRAQPEQDLTVREEDGKLVYGGGRSHIKRVEMPIEDVDATSDEYADQDEQDEAAEQDEAGKSGRRGAAVAAGQDDGASQRSGASEMLGSEDEHSMDDDDDEDDEEEEDDDALGLNVSAADEEFVP